MCLGRDDRSAAGRKRLGDFARNRCLLGTYGAALRAGCWAIRLRLPPVLLEACLDLLSARPRSATPAAALSAGKGRKPGSGEGERTAPAREPLLRNGASCHARRPGSVHGGPF